MYKFVKEKIIKYKMIIIVVIVILLLVIDYLNILSTNGIKVSNLNLSLWNICIPFIILFVTYELINKKEDERFNNKKELLILLINDVYNNCLFWIDIIENGKFNKISEDEFKLNKKQLRNSYNIIEENVFENHNIIIDLIKDGLIADEIINGYIKIKKEFKNYITIYKFKTKKEINIEIREQELKDKINEEIKKLKNNINDV